MLRLVASFSFIAVAHLSDCIFKSVLSKKFPIYRCMHRQASQAENLFLLEAHRSILSLLCYAYALCSYMYHAKSCYHMFHTPLYYIAQALVLWTKDQSLGHISTVLTEP